MPVRRHRDQIALLPLRRRRDLPHRIAARQNRVRLEAVALEPRGDPLEIRTIRLNLLALAQVEMMDVARRPSIRDVDENDSALAVLRERAHVIQNRLVVRRVLEGDQNALVHVRYTPVRSCAISHTFRIAMKNATKYERKRSHAGFTNSPILSLSDVKRTSGNTANDS